GLRRLSGVLAGIGSRGSGAGGPPRSGTGSMEQLRRELIEIVAPVDPGVAAAADVHLVLDAVLVQQLGEGLGALDEEVLVADADREQLDVLVDLIGLLEERLVALLELPGVAAEGRGAPEADVAELARVGQQDAEGLAAAHREPGDGAVLGALERPVVLLDVGDDVLEQL